MPATKKIATANGPVSTTEVIEITDMTAKNEQADALIGKYSLFGTATGLIPVAGVDVAAATAVQTKMIRDLAEIYGYDIDDQLLRTAITTGITAVGGRILSVVAETVAQSFTPLKMLVGGATSAAISGFLTYETGKVYQAQMQQGKDPMEIGVIEIVNHIVAQLQAGKLDPSSYSVKNQLSNFIGSNRQN
ncbi:YcjF family protein [Neolewinella persica]|uniref:YcjF family protein n=1 Tax=Neolewinella persica TaxID=70998 RepID=UPI00036F96B0|nr:YcjF family protein [Neolewinella persica]